MEQNDREGLDPTTGGEQTSFGSQLNSSSESGTPSANGMSGSDAASTGSAAGESQRGVRGRVKNVASAAREKASGIPAMLADGLQAGAEALRQRRPSAESSAGSSVTITSDPTIAAVTDTIATGMQSSADWLRDADLDKLKEGVEKQVKEHPARSLLVALGAGYLIGKALRR
jgi:hypothetical protein